MFESFFQNFNFYGLMIGLAVALFYLLAEKKARQAKIVESVFQKIFLAVILAALLGARLWHVITDFYLYQHDWWGMFKIWQGGLSILGAVAGGIVALLLLQILDKRSARLTLCLKSGTLRFLDSFVLALPFAQSLGRLANFFNQELYGLPSDLPWAIYIDPENRLAGYQQFSHYHPLFAYESLLVLMIGLVLWHWAPWKLGSGYYLKFYLFYYALIRFSLDFIRIDKSMFFNSFLGANQVILLIFLLIILLFKAKAVDKELTIMKKQTKIFFKLTAVFLVLLIVGVGFLLIKKQFNLRDPVLDHQLVTMKIAGQDYQVEIVNTQKSIIQGLSGREEIGSDGLLFILPQKQQPSFWMKEMNFALDFIWIADGRVKDLTENVPVPDPATSLENLPSYRPQKAVEMVLEMEAGEVARRGIELDDPVELSSLRPL